MVLIIRNADFKSNPSMQRIYNGIKHAGRDVITISRIKTKNSKTEIKQKGNDLFVSIFIKESKNKIKKALNLLKFKKEINKIIKKYYDDIGIIHSFDLDTGSNVRKISKKKNIKYNYHIADFYSDSRDLKYKFIKKHYRKKELKVINDANLTIICTEERLEQIKGSKPNKVSVIHNVPMISSSTVKESGIKNKNNNKIVITYIGSLSKNRLSYEIALVISKFPQYTYYVGGVGPESEKIKELSKTSSNIKYLGKLNYDEALIYNKKTDIMIAMYDPIVKNHLFAAPNKIYESLILNKPIIYTKGIGLSSAIKEANSGWLIQYNVKSLEKVLKQITRKQIYSKKKDMHEKSEKYKWENVREKIADIYRKRGNEND